MIEKLTNTILSAHETAILSKSAGKKLLLKVFSETERAHRVFYMGAGENRGTDSLPFFKPTLLAMRMKMCATFRRGAWRSRGRRLEIRGITRRRERVLLSTQFLHSHNHTCVNVCVHFQPARSVWFFSQWHAGVGVSLALVQRVFLCALPFLPPHEIVSSAQAFALKGRARVSLSPGRSKFR